MNHKFVWVDGLACYTTWLNRWASGADGQSRDNYWLNVMQHIYTTLLIEQKRREVSKSMSDTFIPQEGVSFSPKTLATKHALIRTILKLSDGHRYKSLSSKQLQGQAAWKVLTPSRIKDVCGSLSTSLGKIGPLMDLFIPELWYLFLAF